MINFSELRAPFPADKISWRVGSTTRDKDKGMALAYIDARDVQDRLDEVCGPEGWQCTYPHANGKTVCSIGVKVGEEWIWKANGAGDTDFEAEKGALSDAFKRAAVLWGIGRYLYDVDAPWVEIEAHGKSYGIKKHELPKLRACLEGKRPPAPRTEPPASGDGDKAARAKAFANEAVAFLKSVSDPNAFDTWHRANRDKIAKLQSYGDLHKQVTSAVHVKLDQFNPVRAG